jgi:hypothetical protein
LTGPRPASYMPRVRDGGIYKAVTADAVAG